MGSRLSNPSVKPGQRNPIDSNTIRSSSLRDYTPSQRRPRHTGATSLARPQKHPTHGSLYRTFACPLPRLLEGEWPLNESVLPLRDSRTSETASGGLRLWRLVGGLAYGSLPTGSASIHRQCSASAALSPAQASPSDNHRGCEMRGRSGAFSF